MKIQNISAILLFLTFFCFSTILIKKRQEVFKYNNNIVMENKTSSRNLAIDILKIFAIAMVIACHTFNIDVKFFDVAVPLFLVITGYNYTNSMKNKNMSIKEYYSKENLKNKFSRILLPYICFAVFEILLIIFTGNFSGINLSRIVIFGGLGMGSFYTILLVQIILLFPLIYKLIKDKKYFGLLITFLIMFVFEIVFNKVFDISNPVVYELWRNLICRQVFYIASGCFIAMNKNKLLNVVAYLFVFVGLLNYILLKLNIYKPILFLTWPGTTIPFGVFAIGIVYIFTNIIVFKKDNVLISTFSNSTYHIFLVQQAFFYINHEISFSSYYGIWFNIFICCFVGIMFYLIQKGYLKYAKLQKQ